jgi:hypothetical protein
MSQSVNDFFLANEQVLEMLDLSKEGTGESFRRHVFEFVFEMANFLFDGGEFMFPGLQIRMKLFYGR